MAEQFTMDVSVDDKAVILRTNGYLNNVAGETIAEECYKQIDSGKVNFLLDLTNTKMVNSIGEVQQEIFLSVVHLLITFFSNTLTCNVV